MTTIIVQKGRLVWASDPPNTPIAHAKKRDPAFPGECVPSCSELIPVEKAIPSSGLRWEDPDTDLCYRVVDEGRLLPDDGWGVAEYWVNYFNTQWHIFREMVQRGCFDAAITVNTKVKKYRMLDKEKAFEMLYEIRDRNKRRGIKNAHRNKF